MLRIDRVTLVLLGAVVAFILGHTQSRTPYSNQHQYFLHGYAAAGVGELSRDWLANTADPTPAFSQLVRFTPWPFLQGIYDYLLGVYFFALILLAWDVRRSPTGPASENDPTQDWWRLGTLASLLILTHAAIVRWLSVQLLGFDYPWFLQSGLAGQYILGPGLQPSAFGILLVLSLWTYVRGWLVATGLLMVACCNVHATYLLPAALLTLGLQADLVSQGRWRTAVMFGCGVLLGVVPTLVYAVLVFPPTSAETFREAQRILVEIRIPHHCRIDRWFDAVAGLQCLLMLLGLALCWRSRLFLPLIVVAALASGLSVIQSLTQSYGLAVLFPWRASAVLMPVATAMVCGAVAVRTPVQVAVGLMGLAGLAGLAGLVLTFADVGYGVNRQEEATLRTIRERQESGAVWLIPVRVPDPDKGPRGAMSATFSQPPGAATPHLITVDLQRFRLFTGQPIYVDFKAIPYKDVELIEWLRRIRNAQRWYKEKSWHAPATCEELRHEGITHVLIPADQPAIAGWPLLFEDAAYRAYALPAK